ncbi:4'-phosphopantetheinyl transferase superfamily protein [Streptomyces cynarae]|uniref:4'-phosphopantetheinyl transferase superfamily protein n=1 Tax=Streptomyces cynarae TaxID=2981134 RepID=A0ABY6EIU3_9ACTN|nr:4'-phosphopantetheinyl transferase superfamily protein [Streptomyces cynarae]UXY23938.1 4'-phosphopantetheinyl transferase superfamily protein [Streptomyces cynarae]
MSVPSVPEPVVSMGGLLPAVARAAQIMGRDDDVRILPEEVAALGRVPQARMWEFAAGRTCARRAMRALGLPTAPVLIGAHREPVWPRGIVGSITHCPGYCAAAVALGRDLAAVGIDAEPHEALPAGVLEAISAAAERAALEALPSGPVCWDRVLFSAEESIYKAWFALTRTWLDFTDVVVTVHVVSVHASDGSFHGRLIERAAADERAPTGLDGCFVVGAGLVLTAVTMARVGPLRSGMGDR